MQEAEISKISITDVISAVQYGDIDLLKQYIELGEYNINTVDSEGCSLLHWAAINNRIEIARYLIQNKAHVRFKFSILT